MQQQHATKRTGADVVFGHYSIRGEIGKEPLGALYLARDPESGSSVVIRTLRLEEEFEPRDQAEVRKSFFREAEAAARLRHKGIRQLIETGENDGVAWVVMEYIEGEPLTRFTADYDRLPVSDSLELVARAAEALNYAHAEGVVHRDIKPANLIYDVLRDELKITDFGFAHITDSGRSRTGLVLGTPSFKSPEQLADGKVTSASDLFSLGVTLYQLITGKLPFQADSMVALMHSIVSLPHIPPSTARPELTPGIDAVISCALHKDPDKRFQTGVRMAAALRRCAGSLAA
jgi:serine/threonine-protein kinase